MTPGSRTSPLPEESFEFLPEFLTGNLPVPETPEPSALSGPSVGVMEMSSPLLAGQNSSDSCPVPPQKKPLRRIYMKLKIIV